MTQNNKNLTTENCNYKTKDFWYESSGCSMKTSDFWYDLPEELIAQTPLEKRDTSRLMCLNRTTGEVCHKHFYDIIDYLQPGDCLVMNDSRE